MFTPGVKKEGSTLWQKSANFFNYLWEKSVCVGTMWRQSLDSAVTEGRKGTGFQLWAAALSFMQAFKRKRSKLQRQPKSMTQEVASKGA